MGFYRINRESGYHLDLLIGPVVEKEKIHAYTVPLRQFAHGVQHSLSCRGAEQASFRGIAVNYLFFTGKTPEFLLPLYIIDRGIVGNLVKPGGKPGTALKIGQIPVNLEKYFLGKIRGVFPVAQKTQAHAVDGPFVPLNQITEEIPLSGDNTGNDHLIIFV
jgi:hypothetical protein